MPHLKPIMNVAGHRRSRPALLHKIVIVPLTRRPKGAKA
jgi:hypothetical protein